MIQWLETPAFLIGWAVMLGGALGCAALVWWWAIEATIKHLGMTTDVLKALRRIYIERRDKTDIPA